MVNLYIYVIGDVSDILVLKLMLVVGFEVCYLVGELMYFGVVIKYFVVLM